MDEGVRNRSRYAESAPATELSAHVACLWMRRMPADAVSTSRIVPDGCMDIIWQDGALYAAGPDTRPVLTPLRPGARLVGLRFRPGSAPAVLRVPASQLRDARIDLEALWGAEALRLAEWLWQAPDDTTVAERLQHAVRTRLDGPVGDPLVQAVAEAAATTVPYDTRRFSVAALADRLGYSERQLRRRCVDAFGYGPATLRRVLRFHRAVMLARSGRFGNYAELAAALGYTDQAHLAREVRDLAGVPLTVLAGERNTQSMSSGANRSTALPSGS